MAKVKVKKWRGEITEIDTADVTLDGPIRVHRSAGTQEDSEYWVENIYKMGEVIGSKLVTDRDNGGQGWNVYYRLAERGGDDG